MNAITRRELFRRAALMGSYACCSAAFGITTPQLVFGQTGAGNRNLAVILNLFGGCDPLNSFAVPYGIPKYYELRPNIGIPQSDVLQINSTFGLHPMLKNIHRLYGAGDVGLIYSTGEPVGTRSHFTSQDIMSLGVGSQTSGERRGWIGRLGDIHFPNKELNTFALGVGQKIDFVSDRLENSTLVLPNLGSYSIARDSKSGAPGVAYDSILQEQTAAALFETKKTVSGVRSSSRRAVARAYVESDRIKAAVTNNSPTLTYPDTRLGAYLKDVSVLARSNFGTKLCYGGAGGWDNHAGQGSSTGTQANLLKQLDDAIGTFEQDMTALGRWDEVAVCVFTEFGRCTSENTSLGTDHGWGSVMLVIGGAVKGTTFGGGPTLNDLTRDRWLHPKIDYRNPLREIIEWMGYDAAPVFNSPYQRTELNLL